MGRDSLGNEVEVGATSSALRLGDSYVAAWAEVDFRVAQRQNALQIYVTLASALIALMFTGHSLGSGGGLGPQWFSLLLPAISLAFIALNAKHERTIGLLRQYLLECEKTVPSFHGYHILHYSRALEFRRYHDWAAAALVAGVNVLGFMVARASFESSFGWLGWPTFVYVVATVVAVLSVLTVARRDEADFASASRK